MKKGFILFGLTSLLIFACSTDRTQDDAVVFEGVYFQKLTLAEAKVLAGQQGKLVMIDFFSPT